MPDEQLDMLSVSNRNLPPIKVFMFAVFIHLQD